MAIDPDSIEQEQEKPLSKEDGETADHYEKRIDTFLSLNYHAGGYANYYFPETVTRAVIFELLKRYRQANWSVNAHYPNGEVYILSFTRASTHEGDAVRLEGVPEF